MSRCHNADVLTLTSYIPTQVGEDAIKRIPDVPAVTRCRLIRDPHGRFIINGKVLDIITVYDPETHGFE